MGLQPSYTTSTCIRRTHPVLHVEVFEMHARLVGLYNEQFIFVTIIVYCNKKLRAELARDRTILLISVIFSKETQMKGQNKIKN